ncbi:tRNA (adenosine(37)-N6)-threonylcarbamoyltransferase complex dimerization subunit type 1 TsaB [Treponema sp.]
MKVLAFDTATNLLSVALLSNNERFYFQLDCIQRQSERLMELSDAVCSSARIKPNEINLVACMRGPGSFTGLRIGMAAAKGLSSALNIPLIAIPTLDCLAYPHSHWPGLVLPLIDAKKSCFFTALYENGCRKSDYIDASSEEIIHLLQGTEPVLLTGVDALMAEKALAPLLTSGRLRVDPAHRKGHAQELLSLALHRFETEAGGDAETLGPEYLRRSEAELTRAEGKPL